MSESHSSIQLPVLDISQPLTSSFSSLCQACQEWGFFHITNHGISKDLYSRIYSLSKLLFSLPADSKLKLGPSTSVKTYTPHFIASPFFESFRVSGPDFLVSAKSSADVLFNPPNSEFSEIIQEYGSKMTTLSKRIMEIVLKCLGNDFEKYFESEFSNCHGYLRIINYTPPEIVKQEEEVEGLGMHTDMSCVTIVYQDQIGGLQVRSKEGKWMDISPCEGTLVVNVGDLMQAWSNGRLRSSEHRVVLRRPVNRLSLAFFWCFEDEKVILAPDEIVGEGKPRLYKPFVCLDYLKFRESSEKGKFEKVGFTAKDFAGCELLG
ncbi:Oxoglutarate/iron-dependent dioxygenase [Macleaya cordata]|uniref:Oxoglutarate/iron-dependent dioxygenase n=1 Tax=Macleaya cordata TaxID=56857 RepID=A0A200QUC0_MACCD|nr:Oxoglutarate/iron-dependent dioxygenase [Macleaya cordata]